VHLLFQRSSIIVLCSAGVKGFGRARRDAMALRNIVLPGYLVLRRGRTCWTYLQFELNSPRCRLVDGDR